MQRIMLLVVYVLKYLGFPREDSCVFEERCVMPGEYNCNKSSRNQAAAQPIALAVYEVTMQRISRRLFKK